MSKFVTFLGLFAMAGYASASTILDKITGDEFLQEQATLHQPTNLNCADFSGKYKGKCEGSQEDQQFEIKQQGCEYIGMKDKLFPIGGVLDLGITTPATEKDTASIIRASVGFVWNQDRSQLVVDMLGTQKQLGLTKDLTSKSGQAILKLSGQKLLLTWNDSQGKVKQLCEFDKQP